MVWIFIFPAESAGWEKTDGLGGLTTFRQRGAFPPFLTGQPVSVIKSGVEGPRVRRRRNEHVGNSQHCSCGDERPSPFRRSKAPQRRRSQRNSLVP